MNLTQFVISVLSIGATILIVWYVSTTLNAANEMVLDDTPESFTATEAGFDPEPQLQTREYKVGGGQRYTLRQLRDWERAPGPRRVGVQIGHFENESVPEELSGLRRNGAGAVWDPYNERDVVSVVARAIARQLEATDIEVDILPATVPPGYEADVFVAIHADGNRNESVRGFKFAGPRRDYSGRSAALVSSLYDSYGALVPMPEDPNISRRMSAYYAFNWPRYEYAIHPFTPAAIVELGFLTNAADRSLLLNQPNLLATAVTDGILAYLENIPPMTPPPQSLTAPTIPLAGTFTCAPLRTERLNRSEEYPCEPSVQTDTGVTYLLPFVSSTTHPLGSRIVVQEGSYQPIQILDNYFWFAYEATGLFRAAQIEQR